MAKLSDKRLVQLALDAVHGLGVFGDAARERLCDDVLLVLGVRKSGHALAELVDAYNWDGAGAWMMVNACILCGEPAVSPLSRTKSDFGGHIVQVIREGRGVDFDVSDPGFQRLRVAASR